MAIEVNKNKEFEEQKEIKLATDFVSNSYKRINIIFQYKKEDNTFNIFYSDL